MASKRIVAPRLADARFEPTARQLDAVARAAIKVAIREQAALAQATLAQPPAVPKRHARSPV
jgi:hypothetical protein